MSRILIHSNAPWVPTGYGIQTRHLMNMLKWGGHEVAVSAFAGLSGCDITWDNTLIMPSGQMAFGVDVLLPHIDRYQPDLTITLMDFWKLDPIAGALQNHNVAAWLPVDCTPVSRRDATTLLHSRATPIAMSVFGQQQLTLLQDKMGPVVKDPLYIPHTIDMKRGFYPMDDRDAFREELELADKFVVGINAANKDAVRKGFPEMFQAFSLLHRKHPDTVLLLHTTMTNVSGLNLGSLAEDMGIAEAVRFTDQYAIDSGLFTTEMMRRWYNACDTVLMCSYGEGFGIPAIEAQACGTPVVGSDNSALKELTDARHRVQCDPFWNHIHQAWWGRPRPESIARRLFKLYDYTPTQRDDSRLDARSNVQHMYDMDKVTYHWTEAVKVLCS